MDKKDYKAFEKIMASLNELYGDPGKKVSDLKMELYFTALKDLSIGQLNDAVNILIQTKTMKVWPLPAEIRYTVEGNPQDKAAIAFDKLLGAVRSIGPYRTVIFDDPAIHAFIQSYGGWEDICDKTVEEWKFMRSEFVKGYAGLSKRTDVPLKLMGIHDASNARNGWDHKTVPVIVGNEALALEWTERIKIGSGRKAISSGGSK